MKFTLFIFIALSLSTIISIIILLIYIYNIDNYEIIYVAPFVFFISFSFIFSNSYRYKSVFLLIIAISISYVIFFAISISRNNFDFHLGDHNTFYPAIFDSISYSVLTGAFAVPVFLLLLPLTNAVLDMMSWGSTRFLLEQIDHGKDGFSGFASVLLAVVVDIIVAVTCLVWLVALTALVLEALNTIYAWYGIPEFDWKSQIELARNYPLSKGIMVTGMLGTTLLPTVIHMTLGLGHAMTVWSPPAQKTAGLIDDDMPVSARQAVARVMLYRKLWMLPAFALVCLLCWGLFSAFSAWVKPIGLLLEQVALHSSGLISGL